MAGSGVLGFKESLQHPPERRRCMWPSKNTLGHHGRATRPGKAGMLILAAGTPTSPRPIAYMSSNARSKAVIASIGKLYRGLKGPHPRPLRRSVDSWRFDMAQTTGKSLRVKNASDPDET